MTEPTQQELLDARVHFGHLSRKLHPKFAPFIFMKRNGICIIDLNQTKAHLTKAAQAMKLLIQSGKRILFVATKRQAKEFVKATAQKLEQPYVTRRWLGGTLTNFTTMRRLFKDLASLDAVIQEPNYQHLTKREQLMIVRKKKKLEAILQGISTINRLPAALCVVDIKKEHAAIKEANKLGIPIFAIVDSNSNPLLVNYPIPGNDDARSSISLILASLEKELAVGLNNWKQSKEEETVSAPPQIEQETPIPTPKQVTVATTREPAPTPPSPAGPTPLSTIPDQKDLSPSSPPKEDQPQP